MKENKIYKLREIVGRNYKGWPEGTPQHTKDLFVEPHTLSLLLDGPNDEVVYAEVEASEFANSRMNAVTDTHGEGIVCV